MRTKSLRGLCVITDPELIPPDKFEHAVRRALRGGARIVRYRDTGRDRGRRHHRAAHLRDICEAHGAILIVNDDVRLASECDAHGVHIERDEISIDQARDALGFDHIIGVSCFTSLVRARRAVNDGADYVSFGSFFPDHDNPDLARADLSILREAKDEFMVPVAAMGGITLDNAEKLIRQGADMIAVDEAVFGRYDPEQAARRLARLFDRADQEIK